MTLAAAAPSLDKGPSTCRCYSPDLCDCREQRARSQRSTSEQRTTEQPAFTTTAAVQVTSASTGPQIDYGLPIGTNGWQSQRCPECDDDKGKPLSVHIDGGWQCHRCGWKTPSLPPTRDREPIRAGLRLVPLNVIDQLAGLSTAMDVAISDAHKNGRTSNLCVPVHEVARAMAKLPGAIIVTDTKRAKTAPEVNALKALRAINAVVEDGTLHKEVAGVGGTVKGGWKPSIYSIVAPLPTIKHLQRIVGIRSWHKDNRNIQEINVTTEVLEHADGQSTSSQRSLGGNGSTSSRSRRGVASPLPRSVSLEHVAPPPSDANVDGMTPSQARLRARFATTGEERDQWETLANTLEPVDVPRQLDGSVLVPHIFFHCKWGVQCVQHSCIDMCARFEERAARADAEEAQRIASIVRARTADRERERVEAERHLKALGCMTLANFMAQPVLEDREMWE
jgi:hypothetical protein